MLRLTTAIIIFGLAHASANAAEGPRRPCDVGAIFQRIFGDQTPKTLPVHPSAIRVVGEKEFGGTFFKPPQQLPKKLSDGAYVYIIDKQGNLGISIRAPDLKNFKEPLVSHRALANRLQKNLGKEPEVVAAGEIEISLGKVSVLNNKSGTYRGDQPHLDFAENILSRHGLKIEPATQRINIPSTKKLAGNHFPELEEAQAKLVIYQDPKKLALFKKLNALKHRLYEHYPAKIPGRYDPEAFFLSEESHLGTPLYNSDDHLYDIQPASQFLYFSQNPNEEFSVLKRMIDEKGIQQTDQYIDHLSRFEGVFTR